MSTHTVELVDATSNMEPGFSFAVAFEALHTKLALEFRKKCKTLGIKPGDQTVPQEPADVPSVSCEGYLALSQHIKELQHEVQQWRLNMEEMLRGFELRKLEEFEGLREEAENQVVLARHHVEQQVECLKTLHATKVKEIYDIFMQLHQQEPITDELLASIESCTNQQLRTVLATQDQQIEEMQTAEIVSHLKEQRLEQETSRLRLSLAEKERILETMKKEVEELIPKLQGYMDAREHMLTMTIQEKTEEEFQKLQSTLKNEQRENAWLQRALKDNRRKRADRLSRLQDEVQELNLCLAKKDETIRMLEGRFSIPYVKEAFQHWQADITFGGHVVRV